MRITQSSNALCAALLILVSDCLIIYQPVKKIVIQRPTFEVYAHAACRKDLGRGMTLTKSLLTNEPDYV
jgi:hypothetical protein|tara:strand:- start:284 stop:490 length:207 start_codon:yes stop_codon:yes gene_type:complete